MIEEAKDQRQHGSFDMQGGVDRFDHLFSAAHTPAARSTAHTARTRSPVGHPGASMGGAGGARNQRDAKPSVLCDGALPLWVYGGWWRGRERE